MNVCHITTVHSVFDTRIFHRECVSLAKAGYRVHLMARHDREETVDGVHIIPLTPIERSWQRRLLSPRQAFQKAAELDADLYHFHDPELMPTLLRCARRLEKPVIWDAHENYVCNIAYYNQLKVPAISRLAARCFGRYELSACKKSGAAVVAVTDVSAKRYAESGIHTTAIGNYCNLAEVPFPSEVRRDDPPLIITSGLLHENRGVHVLTRAVARIRKTLQCGLAMWGLQDPPRLGEELQSIWRSSGHRDDFELAGPFPWRTLVGELIPRASIGVVLLNTDMQNHRETWSTRIFEYWANGLPVICTGNTVTGEAVRDVGGGIMLSDNREETLVAAILDLLRHPQRAAEMGRRGREAVEEKYSWEVEAGRLVGLYEELLGKREGLRVPELECVVAS